MVETNNIYIYIKQQFNELLKNTDFKNHLECIANRLNKNVENLFFKGFADYDLRVGEYNNNIYGRLDIKAGMHLKYFIKESYHFERQEILYDFLMKSKPNSIVDIGYGAPGFYVRRFINDDEIKQITLLDKFASSRIFTEAFLQCIDDGSGNTKKVKPGEINMDKFELPQVHDTYVLFDSVEHTKEPTKYMKKLVESASHDSKFILSIPIEKADASGQEDGEPMHFIEWLTEEDAKNWLDEVGLEITDAKSVYPNPDGDYWVSNISDASFYNYIVLCRKKQS